MDTRKTFGLMILTVVAAGLVWAGTATAACSPELKERTPQQVLADHRAALAAEDWDAARCNFHPDAKMISDNGVSEGVDAIIAEFQAARHVLRRVTPTRVYSGDHPPDPERRPAHGPGSVHSRHDVQSTSPTASTRTSSEKARSWP